MNTNRRFTLRFKRILHIGAIGFLSLLIVFSTQAELLSAHPSPTSLTPDPLVAALIAQVQTETLYDDVAGLSGMQSVLIGGTPFTLTTRHTAAATSIEKATQYAYERFQSMGLVVSYHPWLYKGNQRRNVVADQPGTNLNCLYLLTAHIDSTSQTPASIAPGADDNASGVAGVLMAADILHQYQFDCSLRYVLFTGEEQGLLGSEAYAQFVANRGDPISGVINLDMIAYNSPGSAATIEMNVRTGSTGNPDRVLSTMMSNVILSYEISLIPGVYAWDEPDSDHYSFWQVGYPAVYVGEDWEDHTPYLHTTNDTLNTLNMPYFTDYVKAIVGTLAHLGQIMPSSWNYAAYFPILAR